MPEQEALFRTEGICKSFNGAPVLKGVNLELRAGEIHALMGENGAGKSTMIKIITGVYEKDAGKIFIEGQQADIRTRADARKNGISVIYQELSLVPYLSVTENVFLGRELMKRGLPDKKAMRKHVAELIEKYGFSLSPDALVAELGMAKRQMTEILKGLSQDARLLILDEPTSALSESETEKLFVTMKSLASQGAAVLFISHRLEEIYRMADRLTVMRDGEIVGVLTKEEVTPERVTMLMIGKELKKSARGASSSPGGRTLEVRGLSYKKLLTDVSFEARGGEILGIGGLVGSGRTELIHCVYGSLRRSGGEVLYDGKPVSASVRRNIKSGFGLVPEDRRGEGIFPVLSVEKNINIASYDRLARANSWVSRKKEIQNAEDAIKKCDVRPARRELPVADFSGGNQQKVVLGRWLSRDLSVLLLDEPTSGVDVGVKAEVYAYIRALADSGAVVIMVSSDIEELTSVSDRILILREGRIFAEFDGKSAAQSDIILANSGVLRERSVRL
ncbi:MAG: sugar ABC transporter ATP-binding protein [Oscillospiraceae bacterium]|jgi:ribose transport system ATP-binding protein|nr:sugar ABC transporter ATP-binding protein [Oscillospiraceae bacterium]